MLARFLREQGYDCRRTSQYCGQTGDAADVVGLPGLHIECKFVERLNIREALAQAIRDAKAGLIVACADAQLELTQIQMPGAKRMNARDYLRGHGMETGIRLGMTEETDER